MLKLINRLKNKDMRRYLRHHIEHNELIYIQKALNLMRDEKILEDNLLGNQTINAIKSVNNAKLMTLASALMNEGIKYEDKNIKITEQEPIKELQYIKIARSYIGTKELKGYKNNDKIIQFHKDANLPIRKITDEIPWCGSFVTSCIKKDKTLKDKLPKYGFRAKSWLDYGISSLTKYKKISYGSIAVKSRKHGGHVTFVIGQSKSGKYLYCLGGNQGDSVKVSKYKKSIFIDFRLPVNIEYQKIPIYHNNNNLSDCVKES